jgi:hypothetical protein
MKSILTCACLFLLTQFVIAQHEILDEFTVKQTNQNVTIKLVISGGRSCDGINVFRGLDSNNVSQIGRIGGICGGVDNPVPFVYVDENPVKNKLVYYRAELGQQGFTSALPFTFLDFDNDVLLYPNPTISVITLNINLENTTALVTIHNALGIQVLQFTTIEQKNKIDIESWPVGNYTATIQFSDKTISIPFIKK